MLSECRNENIVLGVGDIARLLKKLDELKEQGFFSIDEFLRIKEALLPKI